jgi:hypothetical protein
MKIRPSGHFRTRPQGVAPSIQPQLVYGLAKRAPSPPGLHYNHDSSRLVGIWLRCVPCFLWQPQRCFLALVRRASLSRGGHRRRKPSSERHLVVELTQAVRFVRSWRGRLRRLSWLPMSSKEIPYGIRNFLEACRESPDVSRCTLDIFVRGLQYACPCSSGCPTSERTSGHQLRGGLSNMAALIARTVQFVF